MRAIAFCPDSNAQRVTFEAAKGMYSEFRRLRYVEERFRATRSAYWNHAQFQRKMHAWHVHSQSSPALPAE